MNRVDRWIMLFGLLLACIGGAWEWIETALYNYSQHSVVDTVVGIYAAAELAGRIERWIYRLEVTTDDQ